MYPIYIFSLLVGLLASLAHGLTNEQLLELSHKYSDRVIPLTDENHYELLGTPRDAYLAVLFTTSSKQVDCNICDECGVQYDDLVKSWYHDHESSVSNSNGTTSLFFLRANVIDVKKIPKLFSFYGLQKVPRLYIFTPGGDIKTYEEIMLNDHNGYARINHLLKSIETITGITDFEYQEPTDWTNLMVTMFVSFTFVYLVKKHRKRSAKIARSKSFWAILTVGFIILMISGYMFNKIKNVRYASVNKDGSIMYFLPSQLQSQFAIETQVISILYSLVGISVVCLIMCGPYLKKFLKGDKYASIVLDLAPIFLTILIYVLFTGFVSVYKIKQSSYPFTLIKLSQLFTKQEAS